MSGNIFGFALASLLLLGSATNPPEMDGSSSVVPARWFSPQSPWNVEIGPATATDYSAGAMSAYLARQHSINMNWGSAAVYVVYAGRDDGSVSHDLVFSGGGSGAPTWKIPAVPVSRDLVTAATYRLEQKNTDGMTCVVDTANRRFLSFWQPRPTGDGIAIRTGGSTSFGGIGWSHVGPQLPSLGRAAGSNYCGGLIRQSEMQQGEIRHALALAWPKDLIRAPHSPYGGMQYPASFSDGINMTSATAVPMGARLQLDPALTDRQLAAIGLTRPADLVIAHALQRYGGYIVDSNTPTMGGSIYFESRFDHGTSAYGATNPWPIAVIGRMRFVTAPTQVPLDTEAPAKMPAGEQVHSNQ